MNIVNVLIAVAVVALVLYRQLSVRPVREGRGSRLMLILGVVGLVQVVQFQEHHSVGVVAWGLLAVSLVIGAVFGALRGMTVRIWRGQDGVLYRRGTVLTLVLWVVGIGLHVGVEMLARVSDPSAAGMSSATTLLYVALTLGVQQLYVQSRGTPTATGAA